MSSDNNTNPETQLDQAEESLLSAEAKENATDGLKSDAQKLREREMKIMTKQMRSPNQKCTSCFNQWTGVGAGSESFAKFVGVMAWPNTLADVRAPEQYTWSMRALNMFTNVHACMNIMMFLEYYQQSNQMTFYQLDQVEMFSDIIHRCCLIDLAVKSWNWLWTANDFDREIRVSLYMPRHTAVCSAQCCFMGQCFSPLRWYWKKIPVAFSWLLDFALTLLYMYGFGILMTYVLNEDPNFFDDPCELAMTPQFWAMLHMSVMFLFVTNFLMCKIYNNGVCLKACKDFEDNLSLEFWDASSTDSLDRGFSMTNTFDPEMSEMKKESLACQSHYDLPKRLGMYNEVVDANKNPKDFRIPTSKLNWFDKQKAHDGKEWMTRLYVNWINRHSAMTWAALRVIVAFWPVQYEDDEGSYLENLWGFIRRIGDEELLTGYCFYDTYWGLLIFMNVFLLNFFAEGGPCLYVWTAPGGKCSNKMHAHMFFWNVRAWCSLGTSEGAPENIDGNWVKGFAMGCENLMPGSYNAFPCLSPEYNPNTDNTAERNQPSGANYGPMADSLTQGRSVPQGEAKMPAGA